MRCCVDEAEDSGPSKAGGDSEVGSYEEQVEERRRAREARQSVVEEHDLCPRGSSRSGKRGASVSGDEGRRGMCQTLRSTHLSKDAEQESHPEDCVERVLVVEPGGIPDASKRDVVGHQKVERVPAAARAQVRTDGA